MVRRTGYGVDPDGSAIGSRIRPAEVETGRLVDHDDLGGRPMPTGPLDLVTSRLQ